MLRSVAVIAASGILIAGCGGPHPDAPRAAQSAARLAGTERQAAGALIALETAYRHQDVTTICRQIYARSVVGSVNNCLHEYSGLKSVFHGFSLKITRIAVTGDHAIATADVSYERDGKIVREHDTYQLVRERGGWRVVIQQ